MTCYQGVSHCVQNCADGKLCVVLGQVPKFGGKVVNNIGAVHCVYVIRSVQGMLLGKAVVVSLSPTQTVYSVIDIRLTYVRLSNLKLFVELGVATPMVVCFETAIDGPMDNAYNHPKTFRERVQYGRAAHWVLRLARATEARIGSPKREPREGAKAPFSLAFF